MPVAGPTVPQVTLSATDASASETGPDGGTFTISRTGPMDMDLWVRYTIATGPGQATNGLDYTTVSPLTGRAKIPAGEPSATITVAPLDDDVAEGAETVELTLLPDDAYGIVMPDSDEGAQQADAVGAPVFEYDPATGLMTLNAAGNYIANIVLTGPDALTVLLPAFSGNDRGGIVMWESQYFAGKLQAFDAVNGGQSGRYALARYAPGLDVSDFGAVEWGSVPVPNQAGESGWTTVTIRFPETTSASVTIADDDEAGFVVTPTGGLLTTEAGDTAVFEVRLTSRPSADVTVVLSSSDTSEGTASLPSLTFTSDNWSTPQEVTVTGIDDPNPDGNVAYRIITAAATSSDSSYNGLNAPDVLVTNWNDDALPEVTLSVTDASASEAGPDGGAFTVSRTGTTDMDLWVYYTVVTGPGQATYGEDYGIVSATAGRAKVPAGEQSATITIMPLDDGVVEGPEAVSFTLRPDNTYVIAAPSSGSVVIVDNDEPCFVVTPTSGLVTTENGGTAVFEVKLTSKPAADVTITLLSSDTSEGTASVPSLTFTSDNWSTPQVVTVTGVDDQYEDGDVAYSIITGVATGSDTNYNGLNPPDVLVTNLDNDVLPEVTLVATDASASETRTDDGTFTVSRTGPTDVDLWVYYTVATGPGQAADRADYRTLSARAGSVKIPAGQSVAVIGIRPFDDDVVEGLETVAFTLAHDDAYVIGTSSNGSITIADNDEAGFVVTPTSGQITSENGGRAVFEVTLTSKPAADVTIALSSSDTSEGTVSQSSLTFSSDNWDTPQRVTITGVDDRDEDGNVAYSIITAAAASSDPNYAGLNPPDVSVTNQDYEPPDVLEIDLRWLEITPPEGTHELVLIRYGGHPGDPPQLVIVPISTHGGHVVTGSDLTFLTIDTKGSDPGEGSYTEAVLLGGTIPFTSDVSYISYSRGFNSMMSNATTSLSLTGLESIGFAPASMGFAAAPAAETNETALAAAVPLDLNASALEPPSGLADAAHLATGPPVDALRVLFASRRQVDLDQSPDTFNAAGDTLEGLGLVDIAESQAVDLAGSVMTSETDSQPHLLHVPPRPIESSSSATDDDDSGVGVEGLTTDLETDLLADLDALAAPPGR